MRMVEDPGADDRGRTSIAVEEGVVYSFIAVEQG